MIERESLELKFTTKSWKKKVVYDSFCRFIGIVPIKAKSDIYYEEKDIEVENEEGIEEIDTFDDLKNVLQRRFKEKIGVFDALLNIFKKNNLYQIFNMIEMLKFVTKTAKHSNELKELFERVEETIKATEKELQELLHSNPDNPNPFVMYTILFCRGKVNIIDSQLLDKMRYFVGSITEEIKSKLINEEAHFKTILYPIVDLEYGYGFNTDINNIVELFAAFPHDRYSGYSLANIHSNLDIKFKLYEKLGDKVGCNLTNILKLAKKYRNRNLSQKEQKLIKMEIYMKCVETIKIASEDYHVYGYMHDALVIKCLSYLETIRMELTLKCFEDDRLQYMKIISHIESDRSKYMEQVKEYYIWAFGDDWKLFHNLFLMY